MFLILLFLTAVLVIYAFVHHNGEFTATASAIRQIWSGNCRLSCRHSLYSRFSGLSGLDSAGPSVPDPGTSHRPYRGPNFCVCETCPCEMIEDMLSKCRPVTSIYWATLELLSNYYCSFIQILNDNFEYYSRVANCRVSCQRPAQLRGSTQMDSSQNICFGNNMRKPRSDTKVSVMKSLLIRRKSTGEERTESSDNSCDPPNMSTEPPNNVIEESDVENKSQRENCYKCIERGFVCMKNCPKAKKS